MTRVLDLLKQIEADPAHTSHLDEHVLDRFGSPMGQDGTATLTAHGNQTEVVVEVAQGADGDGQPIRIRSGT